MTILCGTDFSEHATTAARAAAAIAKRLALRLELVHVADVPAEVGARLEAQAAELRAELGAEIEPLLETGSADERLVELASSRGAHLIVVGSLGARKQSRWRLGSTAERVAQASPVPVLVARDGPNLEAWARGERSLRVMVGVERTETSRAALQWARDLRAIGPCELVVAQIVWPAKEHERSNIATPMPLDHLRPDLEETLLHELEQWASEPPGSEASFVVKPGWGRVDVHLALLAAELEIDLLVVGTRQRAGIARLWQGSVSRGVLHEATMSVACVPRGTSEPEP